MAYVQEIHPEHELKLLSDQDPFYCAACKEIGFGSCYGCELCMVHGHKECLLPTPTLSHPLKKKWTLQFRPAADSETATSSRFCAACAKPLRGCFYGTAEISKGSCGFHPRCLRLPESVEINKMTLELKKNNKSSKCNWCNKKTLCSNKKEDLPSWSYESKNLHFHVGCVSEMMVEGWKNGSLAHIHPSPSGGGAGGGENHETALSQLRVKLPQEKSERGLGMTATKVAFNLTVSAVTGDPTSILGNSIWFVGEKVCQGVGSLFSGSDSDPGESSTTASEVIGDFLFDLLDV